MAIHSPLSQPQLKAKIQLIRGNPEQWRLTPTQRLSREIAWLGHVTGYAPAKPGEYPSDIPQFSKLNVFRKIFQGETQRENCSLLGTDNVRGQLSAHISALNGSYCLLIFFY